MSYLNRAQLRILEIDFTTDDSDDDIESVDAITVYRDAQSRTAGNGYSVAAQAAASEGAAPSALGTSLGSAEVWIYLGEQIPRPGVIVLDQATQS